MTEHFDCRDYEGQPADLGVLGTPRRRPDGTIDASSITRLSFPEGGALCVLRAMEGADNVTIVWDNDRITARGVRQVSHLRRVIQESA